MLILKVKLKANIVWHLRIAKHIGKQLHYIASHPLLKLHNDCMACCDYSMNQMRLHNTTSSI